MRKWPATQGGGWLYPAVWLDRYSRKVVSGDVREVMPEDLVVRRPRAGLIVHSDQGSQYRATRFKQLLTRHGAQQSMSRRGNYYDNAHAESFWSCFKANYSTAGAFRAWPKPSSKSATISPTAMPSDATRRSATLPKTTSKPTFKQRPHSVRRS